MFLLQKYLMKLSNLFENQDQLSMLKAKRNALYQQLQKGYSEADYKRLEQLDQQIQAMEQGVTPKADLSHLDPSVQRWIDQEKDAREKIADQPRIKAKNRQVADYNKRVEQQQQRKREKRIQDYFTKKFK